MWWKVLKDARRCGKLRVNRSEGVVKRLNFFGRFGREELDVAREYFVLGWSMKRIARERGMTFYRVRKMVKGIDGVVKGLEKKQRTAYSGQRIGFWGRIG